MLLTLILKSDFERNPDGVGAEREANMVEVGREKELDRDIWGDEMVMSMTAKTKHKACLPH